MCDFCWEGGGRNPWGGGPMWRRIRLILATWCIPNKQIPFHTIIINHISLEICLHVSLPINLHITSACKWVVNSVLNSRIELALRIPEPGKNWNINETFWFNTPWVSINTKKKLTVAKNREDTFWGYFPRWPPSAILENELLIYWPYKYV